MRPMREPPTIEAVACIVLLITLLVCSVCYGVQRYVATSHVPAYRVWEYTDIYASESGAVRKCVMEAPDAETAYRNMQALGLKYDPEASMRPCVLHRTRLVALERVP